MLSKVLSKLKKLVGLICMLLVAIVVFVIIFVTVSGYIRDYYRGMRKDSAQERLRNGVLLFSDYGSAEDVRLAVEHLAQTNNNVNNIQRSLEMAGASCGQATAAICAQIYVNGRHKDNHLNAWYKDMYAYDAFNDEKIGQEACSDAVWCSYTHSNNNGLFNTTRYLDILLKHDGQQNLKFVETKQVITGMP